MATSRRSPTCTFWFCSGAERPVFLMKVKTVLAPESRPRHLRDQRSRQTCVRGQQQSPPTPLLLHANATAQLLAKATLASANQRRGGFFTCFRQRSGVDPASFRAHPFRRTPRPLPSTPRLKSFHPAAAPGNAVWAQTAADECVQACRGGGAKRCSGDPAEPSDWIKSWKFESERRPWEDAAGAATQSASRRVFRGQQLQHAARASSRSIKASASPQQTAGATSR